MSQFEHKSKITFSVNLLSPVVSICPPNERLLVPVMLSVFTPAQNRTKQSCLFLPVAGLVQFPVCYESLCLKLSLFISLRLVAISAAIRLALLSSFCSCCWLVLRAFFGYPSSVSNIRPGWPNFILYWITPVWIHTHSNWEPETSVCTCPSAFRDPHASSASRWLSCTQRPPQQLILQYLSETNKNATFGLQACRICAV